MRLRVLFVLVILSLLWSAVPACAQQASSPISPYPGTSAEFELNLTQQDFLPVIRQWITLVPGALAGYLSGMPAGGEENAAPQIAAVMKDVAEQLQVALAGLTQVSVITFRRPEKVGTDQITDFYVRELGLNQGWLRTLAADRPEGSARLYVKPELVAMFGIGITDEYVAVVRTEGKIDFAAIGDLAARYIPMIAAHVGFGREETVQVPGDGSGDWTLVLVEVGPHRVRVLEAIRDVACMTPAEAREFVLSLPRPLVGGISRENADAIRERLEALGATVEVTQ